MIFFSSLSRSVLPLWRDAALLVGMSGVWVVVWIVCCR